MCRIQRAVWIRPKIRGKIMGVLKTLFLLVIAITFCQPVYAVTKCVKLSSSTTCSYANPGNYVVDWMSYCTTSGTSIIIRGISQCSSTSGSSIGQIAPSLEVSDDTDEDYCWCKMISPAVSSIWVYARGSAFCAYDCAHYCANRAANDASFRSALFSGLGD